MLADTSGLYVFTDNMVQRITPPEEEAESADAAAPSESAEPAA